MENRWFTKTGKAKRVPIDMAVLKPLAERAKPHFMDNNFVRVVTEVRKEYPYIDLAEAVAFTVFFTGLFNNESPVFHRLRYDDGEKIFYRVIGK